MFSLGSLDTTSEQLNPPRVALESGTKQPNSAGKYVKIVPKELTIPSRTHVASYIFFLNCSK